MKDVKKELVRISKKIGRQEVMILLINKGISVSTAEKLAYGRYKPTPGHLVNKMILEALNDVPKDN